ncbi:MAG: BTAD domain-containing putative transcriptional regulator [Caldilineaceae bacterium]
MLKAIFFGTPQIQSNYNTLSGVLTGRTLALFTYLAMADQPQERGRLADLLWTDVGEQQARQNLRYVLYDLRKLVGEYLVVTRSTLAFNHQKIHWIDAKVLTTYLANVQTTADPALLQSVLQLYQDEFLAGFYIQNAPGFEAWLVQQRQQLHHQVIQALLLLSEQCLAQGDYTTGLTATRRLLQLEPWQEAAHRHQMRFLVYHGQRMEALAQYATCCQVLQAEYGVEPEAATTQLFHAIGAGELTLPPVRPVHLQRGTIQVDWDVIPQHSRLIGRDAELAQLHRWLVHERRQVIGLFGLAGQGKSALGAELVARLAEAATTATDPYASDIEVILWSTLTTIPSLAHLLHEWLQLLTRAKFDRGAQLTDPAHVAPTVTRDTEPSDVLEMLLRQLLAQLRHRRVLFIVDTGEAIHTSSSLVDMYRPGWEAFGELVRRLAENEHRGCLLLLSRIMPASWTPLARRASTMRTLALSGLSLEAGAALLQLGGRAPDHLLQALAKQSAGHPQSLVKLQELIRNFGGDLLLLSQREATVLAGELFYTLQGHFAQLSAVEQIILLKLTLLPSPQTASALWQHMPSGSTMIVFLEALQTLERHHLLSTDHPGSGLVLPPLVRRFVEQYLVATLTQEIIQSLAQLSYTDTPQPLYCQDNSKQHHLFQPGNETVVDGDLVMPIHRNVRQDKRGMANSLGNSRSESARPLEDSSHAFIDHQSRRDRQRPHLEQLTRTLHYLQRYSLATSDAPSIRLVHLLAVALITQWGIAGARDAIQRLRCFLSKTPTTVSEVGLANLASLHRALHGFDNTATPSALQVMPLSIVPENCLNQP